MKDFIEELSLNQESDLGVDLMVQLEQGTGTRPVLWLLCRAKKRAASAIATLARADVTQTAALIILQSQIQLYDELMMDCQALLARGREADRRLKESEREEIADALDIDEARAAGFEQTPEDT